MEKAIGLICAISFVLGNILAIAYSIDLVISMNKFQNKDVNGIYSSILILIMTTCPVLVIYSFSIEMLRSNGHNNWYIVVFLAICCFSTGVVWTKFVWPQIETIERNYLSSR